MKIVVGLGNPGKKYQNNRHNVGHLFIDYLINQLKDSRINELKIIKTDCFMNESGVFIKKTLHVTRYTLHDLIIVHDDLDIPFGKFHIQLGVGPKLHNGLESIEQHLKTNDFWRIRIGVDARTPQRSVDGETYVLKNFLTEEKIKLEKDIFPKLFLQFQTFLKLQASL